MTARTKKEHLWRYFFCVFGTVIISLGVVMSTKANLGTTSIAAPSYVASLGLPFSFGFFTFCLNILLFIFQLIMSEKNFLRKQYLQIPFFIIFSFFIDFWMWALPVPQIMPYTYSLLYLMGGTFFLALGIVIEVSADAVMLPADGAVLVASMKTGKSFGTVKLFFDIGLVLFGCGLSFIFFNELRGIREGTLISAICVGLTVRLLFLIKNKLFKKT